MTKEERLVQIEKALKESKNPISGAVLAENFGVSRQIIVQDIRVLRAQNIPIVSTNKGYLYNERKKRFKRVVKVRHKDSEIIDEMDTVVDLGACIDDVFIWHRNYGKIEAEIDAKSRRDVRDFVKNMKDSASSPLKNITDSYHYHTISAEDEETLDIVEKALKKKGYWVEEREQ